MSEITLKLSQTDLGNGSVRVSVTARVGEKYSVQYSEVTRQAIDLARFDIIKYEMREVVIRAALSALEIIE